MARQCYSHRLLTILEATEMSRTELSQILGITPGYFGMLLHGYSPEYSVITAPLKSLERGLVVLKKSEKGLKGIELKKLRDFVADDLMVVRKFLSK